MVEERNIRNGQSAKEKSKNDNHSRCDISLWYCEYICQATESNCSFKKKIKEKRLAVAKPWQPTAAAKAVQLQGTTSILLLAP